MSAMSSAAATTADARTTLELVVLPGDGVGPDVTAAALDVLNRVVACYGHELHTATHDIGWCAVERLGEALPDPTRDACAGARAVLVGAVGDPRAAKAPSGQRPEIGLLELRRSLGCFANLRPVRVDPSLAGLSTVRRRVVSGVDLLFVRELTGGIYFGEPRGRVRDEGGRRAFDTMSYSEGEVRRIAHVAFEAAASRRRKVTSIDKANVLEVSRLWREIVDEVAAEHPDVELEHMYVDRAAMELVVRPGRFDVLVTSNMFGDILSDEAAALTGSLGVLPSASLGGETGLYEPVHGSAPDLEPDTANPIGAIGSAALALRHSYGLETEAGVVEQAISTVLASGVRTADLATADATIVGTREFGRAVAREVGRAAGRDRPD